MWVWIHVHNYHDDYVTIQQDEDSNDKEGNGIDRNEFLIFTQLIKLQLNK